MELRRNFEDIRVCFSKTLGCNRIWQWNAFEFKALLFCFIRHGLSRLRSNLLCAAGDKLKGVSTSIHAGHLSEGYIPKMETCRNMKIC